MTGWVIRDCINCASFIGRRFKVFSSNKSQHKLLRSLLAATMRPSGLGCATVARPTKTRAQNSKFSFPLFILSACRRGRPSHRRSALWLLDGPDDILVTAAQEISLPTIKTFMSGNELWNVNSLAIVTANVERWRDEAHLTHEIKQQKYFNSRWCFHTAVRSPDELRPVIFTWAGSFNGGSNTSEALFVRGGKCSRCVWFVCLFIYFR